MRTRYARDWDLSKQPMVCRIGDTVIPANCPIEVDLKTGEAHPLPASERQTVAVACPMAVAPGSAQSP